jgi:diguanylate cyclase (GGDEF)-like protein
MKKADQRSYYEDDHIPDFLVKTTFGCCLVIILILIPFTINSFIQDRFILGLATTFASFTCFVNIWYGLRGRYSLWVNSYLVSPTATITIAYTFYKLGDPGSYWPFLLITAYYFVLPDRRASIFNALALLIFVPMAWYILDLSSAIRFSAVAIGVSLFAVISMREIHNLHKLLKKQATTDKLTGLFNRFKLDAFLRQAIAQNQRTGMPMCLVAIDIDHFKLVNDTFGHHEGDRVLEKLGDLFRRRVRASDTPFRIGGEEFLVLLHNTDEEQGVKVADDLRKVVEEANLVADLPLTISIGVSALEEGMELDSWMKSCDDKLYRAKGAGRNTVVV